MPVDPRLGRLQEWDVRSRAYPIRALVEGKPRRSYTWACPVVLDQGREGSCVGHAWVHEAAARPDRVPDVYSVDAVALYLRAQELDAWPGEAYEGTSVLAGAKAAQERGWMREYRWAFGEDDLALAVGYAGPAVLGIDWYEAMSDPVDGWVRPEGELLGGHALLCVGYSVRADRYRLHNSWGPSWGGGPGLEDGQAWIRRDHLAGLLGRGGEACVPVLRRKRTR